MNTTASAHALTLPAGMHRYTQMERVFHGRAVAQLLPGELDLINARRVFVISNRSLAGSDALKEIIATLGERHVGQYTGVTAHSPRACVIEGALQARQASADLLLAVGGGSVIDAAKAMLMAIRYGYERSAQLDPHANQRPPESGHAPEDASRWLRVLAIPTTLSGAEFASAAGISDPARGMKEGFMNPMMMPISVIMDPAMTLATPLRLMLATGIKAMDHAVERITSSTANPFSDAVSTLSIRLLAQALPGLQRSPDDLQLRAQAQYGMFMSLAGSASGAASNVSHAVGHVLGAHAHVPHGETSCVMSPAVLRWNLAYTADRQSMIRQALGAGDTSAGEALETLVSGLGLPVRLRQVGVRREDFALIAAKTMHEGLLRNSRRPVQSPADIEALLELAW